MDEARQLMERVHKVYDLTDHFHCILVERLDWRLFHSTNLSGHIVGMAEPTTI